MNLQSVTRAKSPDKALRASLAAQGTTITHAPTYQMHGRIQRPITPKNVRRHAAPGHGYSGQVI